ncbi:uncharacterized protein LOC126559529 [Anopheles maculipalpis]|uniref:uncharacterized protein LOC126559529 n=1 Tax=Anopheles maculipalpis TaxID=1496333 RepID=UPI0021599D31|nr:uncharacterized protein LOC126559529 [Anopheles maculipalpis]
MADGMLQRFSTIGSVISGSSSSSSTSMPPMDTASITQRIHHETSPLLTGVKYPVYGPGTGPDLYDDEAAEYWHGSDNNGAGGFFPSFLPWGQGPQGAAHPVPPPPPPPPPAYPVYRGPYGGPFNKGLRFKGASVAVLTLLAFLFFLSILQNYIRDYSTTSQPTVILLSAGATKENLPVYPYRIRQKVGQRGDEPPSRFDDDDDADAPIDEVSEQSEGTTTSGGYRARIRKGHQRPHHKGSSGSSSSSKAVSSGSVSAVPSNAPFGDIFKVNGL